MSLFVSIPLLALAAILQSSVIPQIRIAHGEPDLVFLMVLAYSINANLDRAVIWSFVGGIFQDLLSFAPLGTSVMGMILMTFGVNSLGRQVYGIGFLTLVALVLVGTLVKQFLALIIISASGMPINLISGFTQVILPTMLYNLVFFWPVYGFIRLVQRRAEEPTGARV